MASTLSLRSGEQATTLGTVRNGLLPQLNEPGQDASLTGFKLSDTGRASLINIPADVQVFDADGKLVCDFGGHSLHVDEKISLTFKNRAGDPVLDVDFSPSR
ncbi:MAG: hypothetical protein WC851_01420 [Candidatus Shapirobacteria bacterium]|jgi:hypothetical protein